ncbi:IclR family transcriptional regulator [Pseudonocardia pini]|uniref:IclR family transcriptional regulator n=1 Tax=Pseudonocardia pini TaxID=2758030 RepID=UPI0015F0826C|nr:IclR family transcriptional regulator [Pseudonocardia pini]
MSSHATEHASSRTAAGSAAARNTTGSVTLRALALLDAFSPEHPSLTLSDLARRAGLPVSTTHRLAADLVEWGALERDEDGAFHIALKLWRVANLAPHGSLLRSVAMPYLYELFRVTRQKVYLAVRSNQDVFVVDRVEGLEALTALSPPRGPYPAHATGLGQVLLAFAPPDVLADALSRPLTSFTSRTLTDPGHLRRALADVRRGGVAVVDRQLTNQHLAIAAPVRDGDRAVSVAISVFTRADNPEIRSLGPQVRAAARAISCSLTAMRTSDTAPARIRTHPAPSDRLSHTTDRS